MLFVETPSQGSQERCRVGAPFLLRGGTCTSDQKIATDDGGPTVDFSEVDVFASKGRLLQSSVVVTFVDGPD